MRHLSKTSQTLEPKNLALSRFITIPIMHHPLDGEQIIKWTIKDYIDSSVWLDLLTVGNTFSKNHWLVNTRGYGPAQLKRIYSGRDKVAHIKNYTGANNLSYLCFRQWQTHLCNCFCSRTWMSLMGNGGGWLNTKCT